MKKKVFSSQLSLLKVELKLLIISLLIIFGTSNPIFTVISLLFITLIVLRESINTGMAVLLFLLPFAGVFKLSSDGFALINLVVIVMVCKLLYKSKFKINFLSLLLMLIFLIFNVVFHGNTGIFELIKLCIYMFLFNLFFHNDETKSLRELLTIFSFGIILAATFGTMTEIFPSISHYIGEEAILRTISRERIHRFSGLYNNPNFFTMDITIALACWICLFLADKAKKFDFVFVIFLISYGLMSISNSFILALAILILLFVLQLAKKSIVKLFSFGIIFIFIIFLAYHFIDDQVIYGYIDRVTRAGNFADISEITTGRSDLWQFYIEYIFSSLYSLFFGFGIGVSLYQSAHNFFLEILFNLGVIGTIIYIFNIYCAFDLRKIKNIKGSYVFIPLIMFLFRAYAINLLLRDNTLFFIALIVLCLKEDFIDNKVDRTKNKGMYFYEEQPI